MTCLRDGLEYFCDFVGSEIFHNALMVDKDTTADHLIGQDVWLVGRFSKLCALDRYVDACHWQQKLWIGHSDNSFES
jgi:hypothetical protein